ncbi:MULTISPECIES: SIMPL domain-containing protein [unclassified Corallococcus]|uniref:SIMPL domain-containing protein n=1 Tax=unclassified Corallococcus TaxID=2685029 RepID=UPI001A8EE4A7|nr:MULTISPECIES: SIMPL domain-containing protein [unclassified Corallococcus]MBN9681242.1 SIMPL domain-containing protein [Corallococcus sp. NCSPR001]WAS87177.1 SIMPL domain-containing protein [Corallococcus sp. NCRR]
MSAVRRMLTTLVVLAGFTAAAQTQAPGGSPQPRPPVDPQVRTLRVEGTGEVKAQPDEAFIDVAVETSAANAKAAGEENAKRMEKVLAALTGAGIPKRDLQTRNYNVYPEYTPAPPQGGEPKLKGYRVSNLVSVHVTDLSKVGSLLDKALAAGANRVDSVRFGLSRQDAVQGEALRQAVSRARKSAEVLAASLNVKLGAVLDASTVTEAPRLYPATFAMDMAESRAAPTTPIQPEEQTVQAKVTLIFAIQ